MAERADRHVVLYWNRATPELYTVIREQAPPELEPVFIETEDPAEVSDPIRLLLPKAIVVKRLSAAGGRLEHALANEDDEDAVRDDLATVFPDYVNPPHGSKSELAAALRNGSVGMSKTGLVLGAGPALKKTRAYGAPDG